MASSFMGLYVQREGLILAQKALDITGNNISNINTPGYSRQRVDICSVANSKNTLLYNTAVAMSGRGSEAVGVAQIRDRLLDTKVRNYSGDLCNVGIKVDVLSNVEDIFDSIEADDLGASFASIISEFKAALQGFSADNADRTEMANIAKNAADSLVHTVTNYDAKLTDVSNQTLGDARITTQRINEIFAEMGNLNRDIKTAYISMGYINSNSSNYEVMHDYGPLELKDKMHSLLDELSQYGNISVTEEADGTFTVDFAERLVVRDQFYAQMAITENDPKPTELEFVISKDLLKSDDWYALNVKHGTGGDTELIVRNHQNDVGGTFSISDTNTDGRYKLDKGSLRGYLDVYNGRGIYADCIGAAKTNIQNANDALAALNTFNHTYENTPWADIPKEEADKAAELVKLLEQAVGAAATPDPTNGKYTVTLGGKTLLDPAETDAGSIKLSDTDTVSIAGVNNSAVVNAGIKLDDIGGERGAANFNDALENLADINKTIAYLTVKHNSEEDPTAAAAKINDYLTQLEQYNNDPTSLTDKEVTFLLDSLGGLIKDFSVTETGTGNNKKYSIKSGSKVLLDTTGHTAADEDDVAKLTTSAKVAAATERTEAMKEAQRFIGILEDGGVDVVPDNTTRAYSAKLKGIDLLDGNDCSKARTISVSPKANITEADGTVSSEPVSFIEGAAGKYIKEDADHITNSYRGIEYYRDMLNAFVKTITEEFNGVFAEFNGGQGWEIFTYDDDGDASTPPEFRTAAQNFRVGKNWTDNPEVIANPRGSNKFEELDNVYINKLLGVLSSNQKYGDGTIYHSLEYPVEQFVSQICNEIGSQVGTENSVYKATDIMLTSEEVKRSEVMDVQMDEEGINMMNYQKWYNAIARMISTMDEALDKLINNTGRVGL